MRRLPRSAINLGTVACVLGLGAAHAAADGYSMTVSSRFAWSIGYVVALAVAAYGFGLPELTRTRRHAVLAALGATASAAAAISVVQLFVGDALLPRAVVFGSALVLVPWYVLCARVAGDARSRAEDRERVVLVGDVDEVDRLRADLDRAPERHAVVVASVTPEEVALVDPPRVPLVEVAEAASATLVVLSRRRAERRGRRGADGAAPRRGRPGPHAVAVLRAVARQAAGRGARAGLAALRRRRGPRRPLRAGEAPVRPRARRDRHRRARRSSSR